MLNKIYVKIKNFISKNILFIGVFTITLFAMLYEFPYYIEAPGGVLEVADRIEINNSYKVNGSFNMAYVSEYKATLPMLIIGLLNDDWDIEKKQDVLASNQTDRDLLYQNQILLREATQTAIIYAYQKALKKVNIKSSSVFVTYVLEDAMTNLEIGDEILSVEGVSVNSKESLIEEINKYNEKDTINFLVRKDNKEYDRSGVVQVTGNTKVIGFMASTLKDFDVEPKIQIKYIDSESGPSGGLMTSLTIYNYLTNDDITKGLRIAGTGTIDEYGNVGSIGGVKYKILGAAKDNIKYFIIPVGENYYDAQKVIEDNDLEIKLIPVSTFDEAIIELTKL